jgi:hypothetical protein
VTGTNQCNGRNAAKELYKRHGAPQNTGEVASTPPAPQNSKKVPHLVQVAQGPCAGTGSGRDSRPDGNALRSDLPRPPSWKRPSKVHMWPRPTGVAARNELPRGLRTKVEEVVHPRFLSARRGRRVTEK